MRRKRIAVWAAFALLVGALSVVAAGCGGGDDEGGASTEIEGLGSSLEEIQANAKETPSSTGPAIEFEGNVAPWLAIYDRRMKTNGDKALRAQALEAFAAGQDTWGMTLVREGDVVKLAVRFDEGILRMAGKVGAKFVKESLE